MNLTGRELIQEKPKRLFRWTPEANRAIVEEAIRARLHQNFSMVELEDLIVRLQFVSTSEKISNALESRLKAHVKYAAPL